MSSLQLILNYGGWMSSYVTGKNIICLPSFPKTPHGSVDISNNNLFKFGDALEWHHYILENIFHYLELRDLQSASLVNPFWDILVKRVLQKRISPNWITFSYRPSTDEKSLHLHTSEGFTYGQPSLGMFVYSPDMIKLEQYVWLDKTPNSKMDKMTSFAEYIKKEILPSGVDYCAISCSDIISNEKHFMESVIYHGLLIPFIPNIRVATFQCDSGNPAAFTSDIMDNEKIKCILMFSQQQTIFSESFFSALLKKQHPKTVAIGGGLASDTRMFNRKTYFQSKRCRREIKNLFCMTFLQEQDIEADFDAYSVVINHSMYPSHHRSQTFENELLKLKQSAVLRKHGIIFQFRYFINVTNHETKLIQQYFPNYRFLGFGLNIDWVIGWNTINIENEIDAGGPENPHSSKKLKSGVPKSSYCQSTVLVLITWGKIIKSSYTT